jgi:hypothetical protein
MHTLQVGCNHAVHDRQSGVQTTNLGRTLLPAHDKIARVLIHVDA